jgi:murein DD-endopeptidase MepM/ murein hydrolase activator NlpD
MNLADDKRNNLKNPSWGQILRDNDKNLGPANQVPGAWVLIEGMMHIEKKAHDQAVAKQEAEAQAFAAQKAAEAKAAADAEAAKKAQTVGNGEVEPFNGWHRPVPANSAVSPQYPGHKGIDFAVKSGTPFYAAAGGVAKVIIYDDVRDDEFCIAAFDKLGRKTSEIKDPVQKEVRITRMIGNDEYVLIYAHMSQIDVKDGDIVTAGQEIGKTGNSGCSTGDHAHFEVRKNGVAIDPNLVLNGAINVSSSEINVIDDGHGHSDHEHGSGATDPSVEVPVAVNQPAGDGLLKIDHTAETAKNPDVAVTSDTGDAIEGVSVQDHVDPAIEAVVSQAIEKARLAAEIFNAALDRARSNDSQLVK